jgi:hypothetical protein
MPFPSVIAPPTGRRVGSNKQQSSLPLKTTGLIATAKPALPFRKPSIPASVSVPQSRISIPGTTAPKRQAPDSGKTEKPAPPPKKATAMGEEDRVKAAGSFLDRILKGMDKTYGEPK